MRKSIAVLIASASALATAAQQPQACLDPGLVDGLVFLGRSDMRVEVSRGQPAFMSDVELPAGLVLIGSGVRDLDAHAAMARTTVVAYKTSLPLVRARSAVVTTLEGQGWQVEPDLTLEALVGSAGASNDWVILCRNGERRRVSTKEAGGTRYVTVDSASAANRRECNAPARGAPATPQPQFAAALPDLPVFEFPEGSVRPRGSYRSNSIAASSTLVTTSLPAPRLLDLLAGQMEAQGWRRDAAWSGSSSSGASWIKAGGGQASRGTLEVINRANGSYDVRFSMTVQ
jgi:hypothetical protein